ncbi:hypothetical protein EVB27_091 [Rhizobium phage RHph_TM16]|nr:hypothetical protein EVB27_091 [Rhizobium phage RHph_TM16]
MTEREKHHALAAPCKSCPYRKDVASGVWEAHEYEKLKAYDGEILDQVIAGATAVFLCHQQNNALCSGWLACHGPENLLAMRLNHRIVHHDTYMYETDVPVFSSGTEAAEHGMRDIEAPSEKAIKTMAQVERKRGRKK